MYLLPSLSPALSSLLSLVSQLSKSTPPSYFQLSSSSVFLSSFSLLPLSSLPLSSTLYTCQRERERKSFSNFCSERRVWLLGIDLRGLWLPREPQAPPSPLGWWGGEAWAARPLRRQKPLLPTHRILTPNFHPFRRSNQARRIHNSDDKE